METEIEKAAATYPGQVFTQEDLPYSEQMTAYGQQRAAQRQHRHKKGRRLPTEQAQLRAEAEELRCQHRKQVWAGHLADDVWRILRQEWRRQLQEWQALSRREKRQRRAAHEAQEKNWRLVKVARQQELAQRQAEKAEWRQARQSLRERQACLEQISLPVVTWLAILVVIDNCTRCCLGLPLFTAGVHVTAEMVVEALRVLLPAELQFLISDNGPQFIAEAFATLARTANFIHVRIAPHRACTNGIPERFIGTLKDWLAKHSWSTADELLTLLAEFQAFYGDRPHQGTELKGLSPNEYARRLTCGATC